jgi:uncharacterized repeat protein (TIGR01451 family)
MHTLWVRFVLALVILVQFSIPTHAAELDEYTVFISGFTAFQNQDYKTAADKMSLFLKEYPTTTLRDMALFWLARAQFKLGNRQEAARYMAQFLRENPDTPLRSAVEEELLALAQSYEKGEAIANRTEMPQQAAVPDEKPLVATAPDDRSVVAVVPPPAPSPAGTVAGAERKVERPTVAVTNSKGRRPRKVAKQASSMRERAISEYRSVKERYPGTRAAAVAEERLKELREGNAEPAKGPLPLGPSSGREKGMQVVNLEVGQYAAADFNVLPHAVNNEVGKRVYIPFEVVNRGNDTDSFVLETGFPSKFNPLLAAAANPEKPVTVTPPLAPGGKYNGILALTIPVADVDGRKNSYQVKLVSNYDRDVSLSKEISLVSMAPYLRMIVKPDRENVKPGETVSYRIALLNVGSAAAKSVSFTIAYPAQYEPVDSASKGFRREMKSGLVSDEIAVGSGERKEFNVTFRLKEEALAGQELFCRAELINRQLQIRETFLSSVAVVGKVSGVSVRTAGERLTVLPGQRVLIPLTVTNTGNVRESFNLKTSIPSGFRYALFRTGGDAARQSDEPLSGSIGPLSPKEEASMNLELSAPAEVADGSESMITVSFEPVGGGVSPAVVSVRLTFSRPVVELEMVGKGGRLKPGEISHLVLSVVNRGSGMAKDLEVRSLLPDRLDVVASEPAFTGGQGGERVWRLAELGPGEKRSIVLAYRVKADVAAGTNLRIENLVRYKDQQGNTY